MSSPRIGLEDVLDLKFLGKWDWSPDGRFIAYIWDDGGLQDLWLVEPGVSPPRKLSEARIGVTDFAWVPGRAELWFAQDGSLCQVLLADGNTKPETLFASTSNINGLSWAPDGSTLAFSREGKIWLFSCEDRSFKELSLPGTFTHVGPSGCVAWNPSASKFAFSFQDSETYRQIGVAGKNGKVIWRSYFDRSATILSWIDDHNLAFLLPEGGGVSARVTFIDTRTDRPLLREMYRIEGTGKGPIMFTQLLVSPDRSKLLFLLENDGWAHYYVMDTEIALKGAPESQNALRQVTFGHHEDFGHAGDQAAWWPDSKSFVYASNRKSRGERHLFRHYLDSDLDEEMVGLAGQNTMPKVSSKGKLAFVHCDIFKNMDLWVLEETGPTQVTFSMPPVWTPENQYVPEEVSFKSAGDLTIYGYLMKPKDIPDGKKLPALVWVHGGPIRQMRPGWHPMRSYALFHGFNQYLVDRGYVVLSVNYRGGIGYGRDFREALFHRMGVDDVADICNAGLYLKSLPYVDPDNVGVWGLSYGGYMTLHCLTQRPEVFKIGINIAGIWDFAQYTRWAEKRHGKGTGLFKIYLGGDPDSSPDLYRQASPKTFVEGMKAPLLNVQGTADANVDFEQMNSIIRDCVDHGKYYEVIYYPGEVHTFAHKKTWLDAIPKIQAFMDRYLKK